jgi:hypothetical protein
MVQDRSGRIFLSVEASCFWLSLHAIEQTLLKSILTHLKMILNHGFAVALKCTANVCTYVLS